MYNDRSMLDQVSRSDERHIDAQLADLADLVLEDAGFATLTPAEQHYAYLLYGGALFYSGQFDTAREPIRHASAMADAGEVRGV